MMMMQGHEGRLERSLQRVGADIRVHLQDLPVCVGQDLSTRGASRLVPGQALSAAAQGKYHKFSEILNFFEFF